jgi:hypothetical protein
MVLLLEKISGGDGLHNDWWIASKNAIGVGARGKVKM